MIKQPQMKYLITVIFMLTVSTSYGQKKDTKKKEHPKKETVYKSVRLYKRKNSRIKQELTFRTGNDIKLS